MVSHAEAFVARRWQLPPASFRVDVRRLSGGLESAVARAEIVPPSAVDVGPPRFVIKRLPAGLEREAEIYEAIWRHLEAPPAARLFGRAVSGRTTYLYLEDVRSENRWPWSDAARAAAVCHALARLHQSRSLPSDAFTWDYESELLHSAEATLALASAARQPSGQRHWRRLGDLRRVVATLPRIRERLLSGATTVIHGDVHPGNVLLRDGSEAVALIDWARARIGSPLEDVASWLHSLGCWEPEARRRHDTLLRAYLDASGRPRAIDGTLRIHYWMASASNGLAGAIRYHLSVLSDAQAPDATRWHAARGLPAWERVITRAAALLGTNPDRRA